MENYESKYWGLIYDQMMERDLAGWLAVNRSFYAAQLEGVRGPVLECACGSGLILLYLLERGIDIFGFDASRVMLDSLLKKAPQVGSRLSCQRLETFRFEQQFAAVIIPTNSFSMLTTREQQLAALDNALKHLSPGGKLLLDIRLADLEELKSNAHGVEGRWHEWIHPKTGGVIRQRVVSEPHDFEHQVFRDQCYFEYGDEREVTPMAGRWIFEKEFEDLLRLCGFDQWQVDKGEWGSYWTVQSVAAP